MIKACIDKTLNEKEPIKYTESKENVMQSASEPTPRMAVVRDKLWDIGANIRVKFLNGDPSVQEKVQKYATQWMNYANVNLIFVSDGDAEIRIAFEPDGSWSYLGRDALDMTMIHLVQKQFLFLHLRLKQKSN